MKKIKITVLMVIIAVFLAGCGRQEDEMPQEEDVISENYTIESIALEADGHFVARPVLVGQEVYYIVDTDDAYILHCLNIDDKTDTKEEVPLKELSQGKISDGLPFQLINFTVAPDKSRYYLLSVKPDTNSSDPWNLYIMKQDAEREGKYFAGVTEFEPFHAALSVMQADEEGRLSLRYGSTVYRYDADGKYLGQEEFKKDYDADSKSRRWRAGFEKFGINSQNIMADNTLEDGRLEALTRNWDTGFYELFVLTPSDRPLNDGKTELVLGIMKVNAQIQAVVRNFNKNHEDMYITIREYLPDGNARTTDEAISVLMGDVLAGNGPDLIAVMGIETDCRLLAAQGVLEDLQPYVGQSEGIHEEDYLTTIWKLGKQDGLLFAIPTKFTLQTLVCKQSLLGEQRGMDVADVIALSREHPDSLLVDPSSKSSILGLCGCSAFSYSAAPNTPRL